MSLLDRFGATRAEAGFKPAATESASRPSLCRGCGCDDDHACVFTLPRARGLAGGARERRETVACCWILLDIETSTGLCSACAVRAQWDQDFIRAAWHPDVVAILQGAAA